MAPSPTGEYHIGHIRTVLYNWAFARGSDGGKFVLRIEDTDRARLIEGAAEQILQVIRDYGFGWDEGPYRQSERLDIYKTHAEELMNKGFAYPCFCSEERLKQLREDQQKQGIAATKYDKHCLNLSKEVVEANLAEGKKYVVRLKVPKKETIRFNDVVYGEISVDSKDLDDQILIKSDGFPTYHFAVVVDDHLMGITHVLRGNDWIPSTPKHVLLYKAFGWDLPVYAHLPNLKERGEGKKLSKRFGSVLAVEFLEEGYLPEAVLNYLMFVGWNPGGEREIFSLDEFVKEFDLKDIHKTDLVAFDREKLQWFNGVYIRNLPSRELWERILKWADRFKINDVVLARAKEESTENVEKILDLVRGRMKLLGDFGKLTHYFFEKPQVDRGLLRKFGGEKVDDILGGFREVFDDIDGENWNASTLDRQCHKFLKERGYKPKEAFMTLRAALTGEKATPPLFDVLATLGKEEVSKRMG